jgi:hypothetical protein
VELATEIWLAAGGWEWRRLADGMAGMGIGGALGSRLVGGVACGAWGTRFCSWGSGVRVLVGLGQTMEICYFTGPMGHPRVEIHTRPRPDLLWVRVWVHPRVQFDTHTRTQWVWHPRAPAPTGRTAIPT